MKIKLLILLAFLTQLSFINAQELAIVREKDLFGYIDKTGNYVIEPQFERAVSFYGNRAAVVKDGKWGYINPTGEWAIEAQYDQVKPFNSGVALVRKEDQWNYINTAGEIMNAPMSEKPNDFENGVALYKKDGKVGFFGTDGMLILEPTYDEIFNFQNGHAKVRNGDLWGLVDMKGQIYIPLEYRAMGNYSPNGLWARKGEVYGVLQDSVFTPVVDAARIWDFTEESELARAKHDEKGYGFINKKGEWVIAPAYKISWDFNNGLAAVHKSGKYGYIDEQGREIIPFIYDSAGRFSDDGLAAVSDKNFAGHKEKWGFIDKTGKLVIPKEYALIAKYSVGFELLMKKAFIDGVARVRQRGKWCYLTPDGKILGNKWYENAEYFVDTTKF